MMKVRMTLIVREKFTTPYNLKTKALYPNCHIANYAEISKFPINPLSFNMGNLLYLLIYTTLFEEIKKITLKRYMYVKRTVNTFDALSVGCINFIL